MPKRKYFKRLEPNFSYLGQLPLGVFLNYIKRIKRDIIRHHGRGPIGRDNLDN
jgi:hypothetical protein